MSNTLDYLHGGSTTGRSPPILLLLPLLHACYTRTMHTCSALLL
jgi:hypothetical protein